MEHKSDILNTIKTKTTSMKAINGITMSKRKQHRVHLHEHQKNSEKLAYYE